MCRRRRRLFSSERTTLISQVKWFVYFLIFDFCLLIIIEYLLIQCSYTNILFSFCFKTDNNLHEPWRELNYESTKFV